MTEPITWQEVTVTLGEIKPWAENPRYSTKAEARRILKSLDQFGQAKPINLSPTNDLYDGHQRLSALLTIKGEGHKIKAWQSSRHLTTEERKQFVLSLHEGAVGQWNFEELGNWEPELLATYGFDTDALDQTRREMAFLIEMLGEGEEEAQSGEEGESEEDYSRKIDAPIYTPKEEKPNIGQLFDESKTKELLAEIDASSIPEDEKAFLRVAANRHTVLNFRAIAEYYSHSPAPVQNLMENSALVIIDFGRAIELGYVKLSRDIAEKYEKDYGTA